MPISRRTALAFHYLLDECVPPVLRDRRWFMWVPFRLLFGRNADVFMTFKDRAHRMSEEEFRRVYEETADLHLDRPTDLNEDCIAEVLRRAAGSVLEVGCGRGHLAGLLAASHDVVACDMVVAPDLAERFPSVRFCEESLGGLSFADRSFDTVVCTHVLEHVLDMPRAVAELRRVARRRLVVVLPRQRPYRFTFDLHLHFFPMSSSVLEAFPRHPRLASRRIENLGGDWFYEEELADETTPALSPPPRDR
ncbi:MAG: class I SAM-dependent methyltransferase [Alphaproteobacteria bacterium]